MISQMPCDLLGCLPKDLEGKGRHLRSALEGMLKSEAETLQGVVLYPILTIA